MKTPVGNKEDGLSRDMQEPLLKQRGMKIFKVQNKEITFRNGSGRCLPNSLNDKEDELNQICKILVLWSISGKVIVAFMWS